MNTNYIIKAVVVVGVLISSVCYAEGRISPFISVGYGFGGDILIEHTYYDNYGTKRTEDIRSGSGMGFVGGLDFQFNRFASLRGSIGYKADLLDQIRGDVSFSRIPSELLLLVGSQRHKIGGGVVYHHDVRLTCKVDHVCNETYHFDDQLGYTALYEYRMAAGTGQVGAVGLKYTDIEYSGKDIDQEVSGNSLDLYVSLYF